MLIDRSRDQLGRNRSHTDSVKMNIHDVFEPSSARWQAMNRTRLRRQDSAGQANVSFSNHPHPATRLAAVTCANLRSSASLADGLSDTLNIVYTTMPKKKAQNLRNDYANGMRSIGRMGDGTLLFCCCGKHICAAHLCNFTLNDRILQIPAIQF